MGKVGAFPSVGGTLVGKAGVADRAVHFADRPGRPLPAGEVDRVVIMVSPAGGRPGGAAAGASEFGALRST